MSFSGHKNNSALSAAVLAGGKSSRMGRNKALLELNGMTLIGHVTRIAARVTENVLVITNTPQDYAFLKLPMFTDEVKNIGPLGGIYTALLHSSHPHCLVLACDLPFLSEKLVRTLAETAGAADIVTVDAGSGPEPLCSVYSSACLPAIREQIDSGDYKIMRLLQKVRAHVLPVAGEHELENINTPEDFARAQKHARGRD